MTEFDKSHWAEAEFAQGYREGADFYIIERKRLLGILRSFFAYCINDKPEIKVLDLGCGDGIITGELLKANNSISATLVDGSGDMLNKARERLQGRRNISFVQASFQDIIAGGVIRKDFHFAVSSLAIHHLAMEEKAGLFKTIYSCLETGGYFLNIDVVLAPSDNLEHWYLALWKEWIKERKKALGIEGPGYEDIVQRYKDNTDNKPDILDDQLNALRSAGFTDVDCFYKYGIFSMYGGRKPRSSKK